MTTDGLKPEDVEPLIINSNELSEWNPHKDTELLNQKTVLNLDNRHVRLTLWCIVYIILTSTQMANNLYEYLYWDNINEDWWWTTTEKDEEMTFYSLAMSANSILGWAVVILLCSWYCICCKTNCNNCTAFLFIFGSIMQLATMIYGTQNTCTDDGLSSVDLDMCRCLYVGGCIFLAGFSLYLAVDVIRSIGDDIRVRIFVTSLLIALRSFLMFAYFNYLVKQYDFIRANTEFQFRTLSGSNLSCGIICSIILIIVTLGYGSNNKTINPCILRVLSYFLLSAIGSTMMLGLFYGVSYYQMSIYYAVAGAFLVYDLQYL